MLGLFKRKKPYREEAIRVLTILQQQSRNPFFYNSLHVPDTTEGRFDLLTLHIFMMIERMKHEPAGKAFSQALFDVAFESIDQGYREIGVGDMGIPKRMKKLMLAFNGRLHAYSSAYEKKDRSAFTEAIDRNIYDRVHFKSNESATAQMSDYAFSCLEYLQSLDTHSIMSANITFKNPERLAVNEQSS